MNQTKIIIVILAIILAYPASYGLARCSKIIVQVISVKNWTCYSHTIEARRVGIGSLSFLTFIYKPFCDMETKYWLNKQPIGSELIPKHKE